MGFTQEDIYYAKYTQETYGVPASVTLAQYAWESGYGTSQLARTNNNFFGMRNGSNGWQSFSSKMASFLAHGKLLAGDPYKSAVSGQTTIAGYVNAISPIYAPASDGNAGYAENIMRIIEENNLTQYDNGDYTWTGFASPDNPDYQNPVTTAAAGLGDSILSAIIKGVAVLAVAILGIVFFMTAFDIKIPSGKKAVSE